MEIKHYKELGRGNVVASFSIYFPNIFTTVSGFKLINGRNGLFVAAPGYEYEKDGKKCFGTYFFVDREKQEAFKKKVIDLIQSQAVAERASVIVKFE